MSKYRCIELEERKIIEEKLVHLTPQTARVLRDGREITVPAEQVQVGASCGSCPVKPSPWTA